jgi:hypothetical protein
MRITLSMVSLLNAMDVLRLFKIFDTVLTDTFARSAMSLIRTLIQEIPSHKLNAYTKRLMLNMRDGHLPECEECSSSPRFPLPAIQIPHGIFSVKLCIYTQYTFTIYYMVDNRKSNCKMMKCGKKCLLFDSSFYIFNL